MAEHVLKTIPPYFEAVWSGDKTFEVRKNDRGFQTGDVLTLWEYKPGAHDKFPCPDPACRPRWVRARVSYVFAGDPRWPAMAAGYVVLGLAPIESGKTEAPPTDAGVGAGERE